MAIVDELHVRLPVGVLNWFNKADEDFWIGLIWADGFVERWTIVVKTDGVDRWVEPGEFIDFTRVPRGGQGWDGVVWILEELNEGVE